MRIKILLYITSIVLVTSCTSDSPDIQTLCLRDRIGNYLIKWETNPPMEGTVKIYVSDNPDKFSKSNPAVYAPINQGIATYVTQDNITRKYFRITFNDRYGQIVGARSVSMDSVQNLRDMGGYYNINHKMTRWGKVYRSGDLSRMTSSDSLRLSKLGIKTIIDLRSNQEIAMFPLRLEEPVVVPIPLTVGSSTEIEPFLRFGRIRKGDAIIHMQDVYLKFISDNHEAFAEAFSYFLDKDNYPILFNCTLGKDATGFMAAMLLSALQMSEQTILSDYLASNDYILVNRYASLARSHNPDTQEAITILLSANESFMNPIFLKIRRDYGSMDNFLSSALELTDKDREKLKDILLY